MSARDDDFYWEGLGAQELRMRVCEACGHAAFPPKPGCPRCGDERAAFVAASGDGALYSWTVCHVAFDDAFADEGAYVVGVVDLRDGARIVARLEDVGVSELRDALPLRVRWPSGGPDGRRLVFAPIPEDGR